MYYNCNENFVSMGDQSNDIYLNNIRFTNAWSGYSDSTTDGAEISNDIGKYKSLIITGNKSSGGKRQIDMWERVNVNGDLSVTNQVCIGKTCFNEANLQQFLKSLSAPASAPVPVAPAPVPVAPAPVSSFTFMGAPLPSLPIVQDSSPSDYTKYDGKNTRILYNNKCMKYDLPTDKYMLDNCREDPYMEYTILRDGPNIKFKNIGNKLCVDSHGTGRILNAGCVSHPNQTFIVTNNSNKTVKLFTPGGGTNKQCISCNSDTNECVFDVCDANNINQQMALLL